MISRVGSLRELSQESQNLDILKVNGKTPKNSNQNMDRLIIQRYCELLNNKDSIEYEEKIKDGKRSKQFEDLNAKKARYSVAAPIDSLLRFMSKFTSSTESSSISITDEDWVLVHNLANEGLVSLTQCPLLLPLVMDNLKIPLLMTLVTHCPDLTESDALRVIKWLLSLPGELLIKTKPESAQPHTKAETTNFKISKKKLKSNSNDEANSILIDTIAEIIWKLLHQLLLCIITRPTGFSSTVLSAAIKRYISHSQAALLLRVLSLFLFEYCAGSVPATSTSSFKNRPSESTVSLKFAPSATVYDVTVREENILQAADWVEALLDSHFGSLAIAALTDAPTRGALESLLLYLKELRGSRDGVEEAFGVVSHVVRMNQSLYPFAKYVENEGSDVETSKTMYTVRAGASANGISSVPVRGPVPLTGAYPMYSVEVIHI